MITFVRILALILLLGTTGIFVLKIMFTIPIANTHLFILFIVGAISLLWANARGNKSEE